MGRLDELLRAHPVAAAAAASKPATVVRHRGKGAAVKTSSTMVLGSEASNSLHASVQRKLDAAALAGIDGDDRAPGRRYARRKVVRETVRTVVVDGEERIEVIRTARDAKHASRELDAQARKVREEAAQLERYAAPSTSAEVWASTERARIPGRFQPPRKED